MCSEPLRSQRHPDVTAAVLMGGPEKRVLVLANYDPDWPKRFETHRRRITTALGPRAVSVEHIGSTSVPGLAAKPIIDILVTIPDVTAEEDYVAPLSGAGYELRVREPGHRMLRTAARDVHVHILQPTDPAAIDYLVFRDHLRSDEEDRDFYEKTKRTLIARDWDDMNAYAEAKTSVIEAIMARAQSVTRSR